MATQSKGKTQSKSTAKAASTKKHASARKTQPKKPAAKKETKKINDNLGVSFESEIPKVTREGAGNRSSKYQTMLDGIKEHAKENPDERVAVLAFETQSKATSRYMSVRDATKKREDADHWEVVSRSMGDDDYRVYVKWHEDGKPEDKTV